MLKAEKYLQERRRSQLQETIQETDEARVDANANEAGDVRSMSTLYPYIVALIV